VIVRLKLFAVAKELAGTPLVEIDLPEQATVGDLRKKLAENVPALAPIAGQMMFAVDQRYAGDEVPIAAGSDIACIPPVSGG